MSGDSVPYRIQRDCGTREGRRSATVRGPAGRPLRGNHWHPNTLRLGAEDEALESLRRRSPWRTEGRRRGLSRGYRRAGVGWKPRLDADAL